MTSEGGGCRGARDDCHPALPVFSSITWACDLTSLSLSFPICKMRMIVVPTPPRAVVNIERL